MPDLASLLGEHGLMALFGSAFVSATLLPGGSELLLGAMVSQQQWSLVSLLLWATLGNTLGSMTTFALGRWASTRKRPADFSGRREQMALAWLQRHGHWALLLAWAPLVGDALSLLAGWLRMAPLRATLLIALGKLARYGAVALLAGQIV